MRIKKDKEIPRKERYIGRLSFQELFKEIKNKAARDHQIYTAHVNFGYKLNEIADYLRIHYTTVSKAVKMIEESDRK